MPRRSPEARARQRGTPPPAGGAGVDVFVVGDYCLDLVFAGLPGPLELGREIVAADFAMTPGGAYNSAVALQRLGLRVAWAADFGDDDFSRFALEHARAEGLDESLFVHHRRPLRYVTVAASYPDDRAFLAYYDAAPAVPAGARTVRHVHPRVALIPGFVTGLLLEAGARLAHARGAQVFMDANSNRPLQLAEPAVKQALACVDLFSANAKEARQLTGADDPAEAAGLLSRHCSVVIVKAGRNGAYAYRGGEKAYAPPIPVTAVDTTGAGDCFNAGFIRAWLDGRTLVECLRWGNIVGGLSTLGMGGTGKVVRLADVSAYLDA